MPEKGITRLTLFVINRQLPTANRQPPTANCQPPTANRRKPTKENEIYFH
jgi:hypothetical protein